MSSIAHLPDLHSGAKLCDGGTSTGTQEQQAAARAEDQAEALAAARAEVAKVSSEAAAAREALACLEASGAEAAQAAEQQVAGLQEDVLRQSAQLLDAQQQLRGAERATKEAEGALATSEARCAELQKLEDSGAAPPPLRVQGVCGHPVQNHR